MNKQKISVFWFRRDLRLEDNHGLSKALESPFPVLPLFIFDTNIVDELKADDPRVSFIYKHLKLVSDKLNTISSSLLCKKGNPKDVWKTLLDQFDVQSVFANEDYEPYAIQRDKDIENLLSHHHIELNLFKDQVIFEKYEILKADQKPYTIFTPYKNKWLSLFDEAFTSSFDSGLNEHYLNINLPFPNLSDFGFSESSIQVDDYQIEISKHYQEERNFPYLNKTSHLSPHLRFGTVSVRHIVRHALAHPFFLSELIWREFFMQILFHFPDVVHSNFKPKYNAIKWRNNTAEFEKWKSGNTGYPLVDAGMRELNRTGIMHNRVRMVAASFLCKHLLIDWKWGEAYFAEKLLDYDLALNNGNWQWVAGTGCDSAPYFRIFNPSEQVKKFDPKLDYIRIWVPELDSLNYSSPMVEHKMARERALKTYKEGLAQTQI
ncbi:MAG: cryptochrome/photolyase family protein [Flavobacteriales bacterium]